MTSIDDTHGVVVAELRQRREDLQAVIRHADSKAQALVGVHSLAVAGAVALVKITPHSALLAVAAVLVGLALILVLLALFPQLPRRRSGSWRSWRRLDAADLAAAAAGGEQPEDLAAEVRLLARIAVRKMRAVQLAIVLLITGVLAVAASLVL